MANYGEDYRIGTWRRFVKDWPWPVKEDFPVIPDRTALVVVDMTVNQCDIHADFGVARTLHAKGGKFANYYFENLHRVISQISGLVDFCHKQHIQVVFLTAGPNLPDGRDLPFSLRTFDTEDLHVAEAEEFKGTAHFDLTPQLRPEPKDLVFHKVTQSGFVSTPLDQVLRNMGIDTLILTGVATHACVEATARTASDLGYKIVLVEDGCLTQAPLFQDMTMMYCVTLGWGKVVTTEDVMAELRQLRTAVKR